MDNNLKSFKVKTYKYIYPLYKKVLPKLKEEEYPKYDKGTIEHQHKHTGSILARLAIMYNEIDEKDYMKKCVNEMKNLGLEKNKIQELVDNQKENASVLWFKNEYMVNNKEKLKNELNKYKS